MNAEQQRIAIAEACGFVRTDEWVIGWKRPNPEWPDGYYPCALPDYLNDLNAMHEAEGALSEVKRGYYNAELSKLATGRNLSAAVKEPEFIYNLLHATAAQRAEAFLRALGKWSDS